MGFIKIQEYGILAVVKYSIFLPFFQKEKKIDIISMDLYKSFNNIYTSNFVLYLYKKKYFECKFWRNTILFQYLLKK